MSEPQDAVEGVVDQLAEDEATTAPGPDDLNAEELVRLLETVTAERDDYLALAQAKQAELENFRKQMAKRQAEQLNQAGSSLVEKLLAVLDTFDYGVAHGDESLLAVQAQLVGVLEREGLERVAPDADSPFDPAEHDAVAHEPGDGSSAEPVVAESLRAGYRWNGRLLRPAMVRVRG